MKFPGRRNTKHYFPVNKKDRGVLQFGEFNLSLSDVYIVGLDQLLVDIEIEVEDSFLEKNGFAKGQSFIIDDNLADAIYIEYKRKDTSQVNILGELSGTRFIIILF
jgi:inosine kinase